MCSQNLTWKHFERGGLSKDFVISIILEWLTGRHFLIFFRHFFKFLSNMNFIFNPIICHHNSTTVLVLQPEGDFYKERLPWHFEESENVYYESCYDVS